jgi:hypothetical protein
MKRIAGLLILALAAACTPAPSGPEVSVLKIYQPLIDSKGEKTTSLADMPLSADLKALVDKAETAAKGEPVFDGDFAGNCQDCAGFKDLTIANKADAGLAAGHKGVEASFKLFPDEPRTVLWDMVETPEGWRVDNIVAEGLDLRIISQEAIDTAATPQPGPEGDEAVECIAYLSLSADAAKSAKPPGDTTKMDAAAAAWRKKASGLFGADELAQYLASSVAVFDDLPADQLKTLADGCIAKTPVQ